MTNASASRVTIRITSPLSAPRARRIHVFEGCYRLGVLRKKPLLLGLKLLVGQYDLCLQLYV